MLADAISPAWMRESGSRLQECQLVLAWVAMQWRHYGDTFPTCEAIEVASLLRQELALRRRVHSPTVVPYVRGDKWCRSLSRKSDSSPWTLGPGVHFASSARHLARCSTVADRVQC
jgi:hypothetical protein